MKRFVCAIMVLAIAVLACGCTTPAPSSQAAKEAAAVPDLIGNWSGTMKGYIEEKGYTDYPDEAMTMRVTEQTGRIFSGEIVFSNQTAIHEVKAFAGAINPDGRTFSIVEHGGGSSTGTLLSPGELELVYIERTVPFTIAIDTLEKS